MAVCSRCGQENPEGFRVCGMCGTPLEPAQRRREERKVVTVVFVDLVGFTARAEGLDPEDVRAMLAPFYARLRAALESFGGTVEKFIGDAVMAVFGAPVAHEDDPERAVRAALAAREAVADLNEEGGGPALQIRVGINTGEALVTLDADPREGEGMVAGDIVNTAARLQAAAPVDGILVGESTRRATAAVVDYRPHEFVQAKGKADPVAAWEALEYRPRLVEVSRREHKAPLIGRERELDLLRTSLERIRTDRSTQLVTLVGVPGIGKSRLVLELLREVEGDPEEIVFWRQGRSLPYGEGVSFWALGEIVKAQAGILESDSGEEAARKLAASVAALVRDEDDPAWVERHLRPLVGLGGEAASGDKRDEAYSAWRRFLESLAERRPAVLVFDDLHWADDGLLEFVDELVEWTAGVPLLVIATARPELLGRRPGWGGGKANSATVSLEPLSDEETAKLFAALLERSVLPAELQAGLLGRAGGNPLYAEEFARLVVERPAQDGEAVPVPDSVQSIIAARLDLLEPEEKRLLQDAAVLGGLFWIGAVAAVSGVDADDVARALHTLERRQLVRRERRPIVAGEVQYAFLHLLVRDVAYGQIPRAARTEKHRRAAEWIAALGPERLEDRAEMLAHHYSAALEFARAAGQGTAPLEEPARLALRAAGERNLALNSYAGAVRFFEGAVELWPPDDPEHPHLLFQYGRALWLHKAQGEAVLEEARQGLLAAGDLETAAEADALQASVVWGQGRGERALELIQRAQALAESLPPSESKARVLVQVSRQLMLAGRNQEAFDRGREVLGLADRLGLAELRSGALNNIGVARADMGDRGGLDDIAASIALAEEVASPWELARGYINLASTTALFGDQRRSRELHEEGLALTERYGMTGSLRWLRAELALDLYLAGEWDEAGAIAAELIAATEAGSSHYMDWAPRYVRAAIRLASGERSGALEDAEEMLAVARVSGDPQTLHSALGLSARLRAEMGEVEGARACVEELLRVRKRGRDKLNWAFWFHELAMALEILGRREVLTPLLEESREIPSPWIRAGEAFSRGEFSRAAAIFAEIGSEADEAWARLRAAEALVAENRRAEAQAELDRALAFYRRAGADAYTRRGEALLARAG